MLGQLQDSGNTVTLAHYLDVLGKANILTGLQKFAGNKISIRKVHTSSCSTILHLCLLSRSKEEGFELVWWRDRDKEVDFLIQKGNLLTAIEVKSGKIKNIGGSLEFKKRYPKAFSLIVGGSNFGLEDFLSDKVPLFL